VRNRSNDDDFQYHQSPDFYYLTGNTEPNSMLIITKNEIEVEEKKANEFLFVQNRNAAREVWTGRRLGKDGAEKILGFSAVFISGDFQNTQIDFSKFSTILILPDPKGVVPDKYDEDDLAGLISAFKVKTVIKESIIDDSSLKTILSSLREIKQKDEIKLMRKAIDISVDAHIEMMKTAKPGMNEYEVQAIGEYVFKKNGSEYVGYPSICGGGENSCILHYISNRKPLSANDLILLDMGAEYHGYTADVTRTFPVGGKFSPEQKNIYELVLQSQDSGIAQCKSENAFSAPHKAATAVIASGLVKLGIIKSESEVRKYFMHGTSHYLGLDVHDAGTRGKLKPGNVITVEPGIYIPEGSDCDRKWWNIGVRIEDDVLITESGYENLSAKAPRKVADIERMIAEKSSIFIEK
ncbi:MAG: aminopeptidase P family protein, partial [Bacteroidia bacterium]|nr:aminopeptidase P family protein [Bacteroidia bacterium]